MTRRRVLAAVVAVLILLALAWWGREAVEVDRRLDAGGRWDGATRTCAF